MPTREDWEYLAKVVPEPGDGDVVVRIKYISLDPAMRGWVRDMPSYIPPVGIGEVMRALAVGRVVATNAPELAVGDHVVGMLGVQEYAVVDGAGVTKVDPSLGAAAAVPERARDARDDRLLRAARHR